jgi:vacuolar-type H+-ATPase subunit H
MSRGETEILDRLGECERALDARLAEARARKDAIVEEAKRRAAALVEAAKVEADEALARQRADRIGSRRRREAEHHAQAAAQLEALRQRARARWEEALAQVLDRIRSIP